MHHFLHPLQNQKRINLREDLPRWQSLVRIWLGVSPQVRNQTYVFPYMSALYDPRQLEQSKTHAFANQHSSSFTVLSSVYRNYWPYSRRRLQPVTIHPTLSLKAPHPYRSCFYHYTKLIMLMQWQLSVRRSGHRIVLNQLSKLGLTVLLPDL